MHILAASVDYLPQMGGISMMTHHLANALVDAGAEVTLLTQQPGTSESEWPRKYRLVEDVSANTTILEGEAFADRECQRVQQLVDSIHQNKPIDRLLAFHAHYYGQAFRRIAQQKDLLLSLVIHGGELRHQMQWDAVWRVAQKFLQSHRTTLEIEMFRLLRDSDEVLVNSPYTGSLVGRVARKSRVKVIGCGVSQSELRRFSEDRAFLSDSEIADLKRHWGLPLNGVLVGSVGRIVPSKNIELLFSAAAKNSSLSVILAGDGAHRHELENLARSLGISDRVFWLGRISDDQKWQFLQTLDVFCLLSRKMPNGDVEGFGIAALEAALVGTPVIGSRSGGIPFFIEDQKTGLLVEPDDVDGLINAIQRLTKDEAFAAKCIQNLHKALETRFNWQTIAEGLLENWSA